MQVMEESRTQRVFPVNTHPDVINPAGLLSADPDGYAAHVNSGGQ